jgi:hypothetical protein
MKLYECRQLSTQHSVFSTVNYGVRFVLLLFC